MSSVNNFEVSLVNYLCPICGKVAEEGIIMNSLLTEKAAKGVKELHGKAIGYADKCCEECAKYKDQGIFFIGIDPSKSDKEPYRTGQIACVNKESDLAIHVKDFIITLSDGTKYVFIDENVGKEMGIW